MPFALVLVAVQPPLDVMALVEKCVIRCGMTHKEAAWYCGMDASQWSRAIRGEPGYDIGLRRLACMPMKFHLKFLPKLLQSVMEAHFEKATIEKVATQRAA